MKKNDKKRDAMINDIMCDFDFDKVHAVMVVLGVKWLDADGCDGRHTPTVEEIKAVSREILTEAYDNHNANPEFNGIGRYRMFAEVFGDGQLELTYRPFSASAFEVDYNEDGTHRDNY